MNFGVLSRSFAWFGLFASTFFLALVVFLRLKMLVDKIQSVHPTELIPLKPSWFSFAIFLFYCSVDIGAKRKLLAATKKGVGPKIAIHLSDLYLLLEYISMVMGFVRLVSMAVNQRKISMIYWECDNGHFCWRHFLDMGIIVIDCLGLLCVYAFRRELKSSIPNSITEVYITGPD